LAERGTRASDGAGSGLRAARDHPSGRQATMLTSTAERVTSHTSPEITERIRRETESRLDYLAVHREQIPQRLRDLDREWDVERALETGSSTLTLLGLVLGTTVDRKWLWLSLGVQGFFLQHALQGWCPPLPLLRRLGMRTAQEIEAERCALLAMERAPASGRERAGAHAQPFA
jgi:hypothetical protein